MPVRADFVPGEFCWVDHNAHDLEAAAAWYGQRFGWSHALAETPGGGPPYAFLTRGDAVVGGLGQMSDEMKAQGVPPLWNAYVATADCRATEARARELGGTVTVPTMEIPGHGRLAFFLDPEGASIAAWETVGDGGPGVLVGQPGALCWTELMTRDVDRARSFYGSLFGWDFAAMPMGDAEYTMARADGRDAAGMMSMDGPQFDGIPAHWMVYFAVEDCEALAADVAGSGGAVIVPPTPIPVGTFSVLRDPQGGTFSAIALAASPGC